MNTEKIEADDIKPLHDELARIDSIKTLKELQAEITRLHQFGNNVLFGFSSGQDFKDSTQVTGEVDQGGLGLPDRDYYTAR